MVGIGAIPAALQLILLPVLPESRGYFIYLCSDLTPGTE